jgi:hypothetical protein
MFTTRVCCQPVTVPVPNYATDDRIEPRKYLSLVKSVPALQSAGRSLLEPSPLLISQLKPLLGRLPAVTSERGKIQSPT